MIKYRWNQGGSITIVLKKPSLRHFKKPLTENKAVADQYEHGNDDLCQELHNSLKKRHLFYCDESIAINSSKKRS
jgi:hypothetical protein